MGYAGKYCNVSALHIPCPSKRIEPKATGKELIQEVTRISNFKDKELLAGMLQQKLPKHQTDIPFWIHEIHKVKITCIVKISQSDPFSCRRRLQIRHATAQATGLDVAASVTPSSRALGTDTVWEMGPANVSWDMSGNTAM